MNESLRYIVTTRLEPDMMQMVTGLVDERGETRGEVLRGLIHAGLLMRHEFKGAHKFCLTCFMPEAHVIHVTGKELESFYQFKKEQGIGT